MVSGIFINLPVKDLKKSIEFFTQLGFTFNQNFTDETATCMIVSDTISVMLVSETRFKTFSFNEICDTSKSTEVLNCLQVESKERIEKLVASALKAGGSTFREADDNDFMYGHAFKDLDGHIWELVFMKSSADTK